MRGKMALVSLPIIHSLHAMLVFLPYQAIYPDLAEIAMTQLLR